MASLRSSMFIVLTLVLSLAQVSQGVTLNLIKAQNLATGDYSITADSQTFDARVDNDGTHAWLLVGRGRQGWAWNNAGQGSVAAVNDNLGTTAAFSPTYYSSAIINDLIASSGIDLKDIEIRLRRASNTAGTTYQEVRWRPTVETAWRWNFDSPNSGDTSGLALEHQILAGSTGGPFLDTTSNSRDTLATTGTDTDNGFQRVFTWAWANHNNQLGFSYGQNVAGADNNSPTSFLWENTNENHAIPYTEVFIRRISAVPVPEPATATLGLLGLGGLMLRRRRMA